MSRGLMRDVAAAITRRGAATLDDIVREFPRKTRHQLHHALLNGRRAGLVRIKSQGGRGTSERQTEWEAGDDREPSQPALAMPARSVFDIAGESLWQGPWPPQGMQGQRYEPLGGWND